MKFNKKIAVAVSGAVLLLAGQIALADSTTDIVDALVSKGVLTEEEGKLITKGHESKKKAEGTVGFKDGFKINSGDGKSNFSVNGRIQTDFRSFDNQSEKNQVADTFDIRRAYLTTKGTFRGWINYEATLNAGAAGAQNGTASNSLLKYYWLETAFSEKLKVRFGQFKTPMGYETQTSSRFNDTTERDWVAVLSPSINKGVMVHGVPIVGTTYQFMISNGGIGYETGETAIETISQADGKSYSGRLTANIAEIMGNKDAIAHIGASYVYDDAVPDGTLSLRTNARGATFFKTGNIGQSNITRYGLEGILANGPYRLAAEYASQSMEDYGVNQPDREIEAYYINASWMITGENYSTAYKNGLGDRMRPNKDFTGLDSAGWGAWELTLRYSDVDATDFKTSGTNYAGLASNYQSTAAHSYTAGIKWIVDPNTRFLLNYVDTKYNDPTKSGVSAGALADGEKAINVRAQFDF